MRERLDSIAQQVAPARSDEAAQGLSTGERCYVALASGRYDLLPAAYPDPIEAWFRLEEDWRRGVCFQRNWPLDWARPRIVIDDQRWWEESRRAIRFQVECESLWDLVQRYGHHTSDCPARHDEEYFTCYCGWKNEREEARNSMEADNG